jgi:hypothetical protein
VSTNQPRVLLMRLSCRTSSKGTEYLSGYLGAARVVAFKAREPDKFGNEQWELFVSESQPKGDQAPRQEILPPERPARGQSTWNAIRDHDLPTGRTVEHRNERQDQRQQHVDELASRFKPDEEIPF